MAEPDLDNRDYARFAWARYRQIMTWMTLAAVLTVVVSLGLLQLAMGRFRCLRWCIPAAASS